MELDTYKPTRTHARPRAPADWHPTARDIINTRTQKGSQTQFTFATLLLLNFKLLILLPFI